MNKKIIASVVVAIIVIIAVSVLSYGNMISNTNNQTINEKPANTTGRHFTVELKESVGIAENP